MLGRRDQSDPARSAGVTSGIPRTLKAMADMAGNAEATRVGEAIRYPGWSLEAPTSIPSQAFGIEDGALLLNTAFPCSDLFWVWYPRKS